MKFTALQQLILITILASFHFLVAGQVAARPVLTLNHISLSVKDVNRSANFYSEVLGLSEITNRTEAAGIRWFSIGDGKELHLISNAGKAVSINKSVHIAFSVADLSSFILNLHAMKVEFTDWPGNKDKISVRADGIHQVYFQDPDGYWIEVNTAGE